MLGWGNPSLLSPNLALSPGDLTPTFPKGRHSVEAPGARTGGKAGSELPTTW